jgi:hypothetical protein
VELFNGTVGIEGRIVGELIGCAVVGGPLLMGEDDVARVVDVTTVVIAAVVDVVVPVMGGVDGEYIIVGETLGLFVGGDLPEGERVEFILDIVGLSVELSRGTVGIVGPRVLDDE